MCDKCKVLVDECKKKFSNTYKVEVTLRAPKNVGGIEVILEIDEVLKKYTNYHISSVGGSPTPNIIDGKQVFNDFLAGREEKVDPTALEITKDVEATLNQRITALRDCVQDIVWGLDMHINMHHEPKITKDFLRTLTKIIKSV